MPAETSTAADDAESTDGLRGWLRSDLRIGIRNTIVVAYLVECAHHVAREVVRPFEGRDVHVIGFPGCYPNGYAQDMMERLCTHPNVGGALLLSLGCESFNKYRLGDVIAESGRPVETLTIQTNGGTRSTVEAGRAWVSRTLERLAAEEPVPMHTDQLVVGSICGGSDGTSGITGNPAAGLAFDRLVADGATCIFEETGELIGCEDAMASRAATPELADALIASVSKAATYYASMGYGSFAPGNADGGLTTIEEKSLGAYAKSGSAEISGIIKPGVTPDKPGLYLMDVVPDGDPRFGFPNINDSAEVVELIASGAHVVLFVTGRGSVVGSAISPVIKVCANPDTYRAMPDDMDVNAGRILEGHGTLAEVGDEIHDLVLDVARGRRTTSEQLGHYEFILTYKSLEPLGPGCLPAA